VNETAIAMIEVPPPSQRPPGVTPKQWRLAVLLPRAEVAYKACLQAGYAPSTAIQHSSRLARAVGTKLAMTAIQERQRDSSRGLASLARSALNSVSGDEIKGLDVRDRLQVGLQATKLAHEIGAGVEEIGVASSARTRRRKGMTRAYRAGFRAALEGRDPLGLVDSQRSQL